jgi:putative redox protein
MIASAIWKHDQQFEVTSDSGHTTTYDVAKAAGPTPMEAVLTALCGCTAIDVLSILNKKREGHTGIHVHATAEKAAESPSVFTHIRLIYRVSGLVNRKSVEDAVHLSKTKYCSVSAMLEKTAKIDFVIEYDETAGAQAGDGREYGA